MNTQELLNRVRQRAGVDDQETQALIARVTTDSVILAARAAAGEDVESELRHVRAQALALNAEFVGIIGEEVRNWLLEAVGIVVAGLSATA